MTEIHIKKAVKAGNSSAVILPRAWLNKEIRVELIKKTPEIILLETLDIARKHINISEIIGIYLTGSYARKEESSDSDVDMLIITSNIDKSIKEGAYNILFVSKSLLMQKLKKDLFPIGQMIKECKPLLNADYLSNLEIKPTESNIKWYLETSEEKLKMIKKIIENLEKSNKKYADSRIAYTLILRIRTMYIIKNLIEDKNYSKAEFMALIKRISKGNNAYKAYLAIKEDLAQKSIVSLEELRSLYEYLKNQLKDVKSIKLEKELSN
jgi:hypothetical protein